MAGVLSELLGIDSQQLLASITRLEAASGRPGVDVQLISDISVKVQQKIRELGLDPQDTTAQELYGALQALIQRHDTFLAIALGSNDYPNEEPLQTLQRIAAYVNNANIPKKCWAIKPASMRRLLKKQPPKKVIKSLHYRSVDSMLKRESTGVILCAARCLESGPWNEKFVKSYKSLKPIDFEQREVEVVVLDNNRWADVFQEYVSSKHANITHLKEFGTVALLPVRDLPNDGRYITLLPIIIHYVTELRLYSAFFKLHQVKPNFGDILVRTILHDPSELSIANEPIHWKDIGKHFGKNGKTHPEAFEPHVQPDDLVTRQAEAVLFRLEPALQFWEGLEHIVVKKDNHIISLGLLDNAVSYCNGLPLESSSLMYARKNLWAELIARYLRQQPLEQEVLAQLAGEPVSADFGETK